MPWSSGWHLLSCTGRREQKKRRTKKKDIHPHKFFLRHTCDSVPVQSRDANFKNHTAQFQVQPVYQCVAIWFVVVYIFPCWEARHLLKWQSGSLHANWLLLWNPNLPSYQILQVSTNSFNHINTLKKKTPKLWKRMGKLLEYLFSTSNKPNKLLIKQAVCHLQQLELFVRTACSS